MAHRAITSCGAAAPGERAGPRDEEWDAFPSPPVAVVLPRERLDVAAAGALAEELQVTMHTGGAPVRQMHFVPWQGSVGLLVVLAPGSLAVADEVAAALLRCSKEDFDVLAGTEAEVVRVRRGLAEKGTIERPAGARPAVVALPGGSFAVGEDAASAVVVQPEYAGGGPGATLQTVVDGHIKVPHNARGEFFVLAFRGNGVPLAGFVVFIVPPELVAGLTCKPDTVRLGVLRDVVTFREPIPSAYAVELAGVLTKHGCDELAELVMKHFSRGRFLLRLVSATEQVDRALVGESATGRVLSAWMWCTEQNSPEDEEAFLRYWTHVSRERASMACLVARVMHPIGFLIATAPSTAAVQRRGHDQQDCKLTLLILMVLPAVTLFVVGCLELMSPHFWTRQQNFWRMLGMNVHAITQNALVLSGCARRTLYARSNVELLIASYMMGLRIHKGAFSCTKALFAWFVMYVGAASVVGWHQLSLLECLRDVVLRILVPWAIVATIEGEQRRALYLRR